MVNSVMHAFISLFTARVTFLCTRTKYVIGLHSSGKPTKHHRYALTSSDHKFRPKPFTFSSRMPIWFIRPLRKSRLLLRVIMEWHTIPMWTSHPLIPTTSPLDLQRPSAVVLPVAHALGLCIPKPAFIAAVMRVTAARAAADAEEPEERCRPREDDA